MIADKAKNSPYITIERIVSEYQCNNLANIDNI
jgi:hypothetical protein